MIFQILKANTRMMRASSSKKVSTGIEKVGKSLGTASIVVTKRSSPVNNATITDRVRISAH